jgi:hypothetical protein
VASGRASTLNREFTQSATLGSVVRSTFAREKPPLAKPGRAGDNRVVDVGDLIRSRIRSKLKSMKRGSSSSRFDWLTETGCVLRRFFSRHDEAEFPTASQTVCNLRTSRGSRALDCASPDALHPLNNLETKHKHELAFIRETPAPWARSISTKRRSRAFSRSAARAGSEAENILATHRRIFWRKRRPKETSHAFA